MRKVDSLTSWFQLGYNKVKYILQILTLFQLVLGQLVQQIFRLINLDLMTTLNMNSSKPIPSPMLMEELDFMALAAKISLSQSLNWSYSIWMFGTGKMVAKRRNHWGARMQRCKGGRTILWNVLKISWKKIVDVDCRVWPKCIV